MEKLNRSDIHTIARYSNWSEEGIESSLQSDVYSNVKQWRQFLRLFLLACGLGFFVSGVIFFFAYNWDALHRFAKIGMVISGITGMTITVLLLRMEKVYQEILVTASAVLIGVLFAVFGQIYQTGANAYDFFMAWTVFIFLWVIVANFSALWFVFMLLLQTTVFLYAEQVAHHWPETSVFTSLAWINVVFIIGAKVIDKRWYAIANWLEYALAMAAIVFITSASSEVIFHSYLDNTPIYSLLSTLLIFGAGLFYGLKARKSVYIALVGLSSLVLIMNLILEYSHDAGSFFLASILMVGGVSALIKVIIDLQKKWKNEG